jgi:hypothetical protein
MSILLKVKSHDPAVTQERREMAESVIHEFGNGVPDLRLLAFLDDHDCEALKREIGKANRGLYKPLKSGAGGINGWYLFPQDVQEAVFAAEPPLYSVRKMADHLIYLHGGTCANLTSLVMTFAHELQHFVQHGKNPELWAASTVLFSFEKDFYKKAALRVFDIPIEFEARIVSKRIAVTLCGAESVNSYIENRIAEAITPEDVEDWQFVRDLKIQSIDLMALSKQTFRRLLPYRQQIEHALDLARDEPEFKQLDLSKLFLC